MDRLLEHFRTSFLPRLAAGDRKLLKWFQERGCDVVHADNGVSVTFEFVHLFNALSASASASRLEPPTPWDWSKQFKEFCDQLMHPWPIGMFEVAGLEIRTVHQSNSYARTKYKIFSIRPEHEVP